MTDDPGMRAPEAVSVRWGLVVESLNRPYRVTLSMVVLVSLVPVYLFLPGLIPNRTFYAPELAWDRAMPLEPAWALVVWIAAYVCFLIYPTVAPRPAEVMGEGFAVWGLRFLYSSDPPYNCFPSLHVAHSFVSALACYRVHRGVGIIAALCALLVGVSTLFTKQHYISDVVAGMFLASVAYAVFLRTDPREEIPELDRRLAPALTLCILGILGLGVACFWVAYRLSGEA